MTSEPDRKVTLDLGLTYDTSHENMQKAMDLLQQITTQITEVDDTKTVTAFNAFGDFALNIRFIYYIKKGSSVFGTMTKLNLEVLEKFNANGLEFAFPTQNIYNLRQ